MLRCVPGRVPGRVPVLALVAMLAAIAPALAQLPRSFPANALRGELVVVQPPDVMLNGVPARLAPGARIRGQNNLLQMSGALVGAKLLVHYTPDPEGLLLNIWVLTAEEAGRKPWPTTLEQAQRWNFDPAAQSWVRR